MRNFALLFSFLLLCFKGYTQDIEASLIIELESPLTSTSGLIFLEDKIITHADSGNETALYEIDTLTGSFDRKVIIDNASNVDWEDICMDAEYIYIGDTGNNDGSRTDLRIYRVSIEDYLETTNDTILADTINYSYANQVDFTPVLFNTNFDSECLISYGDSLYLFSKNWGNFECDIYSLPKDPGTYQVQKIDSFDPFGLITGGVYHEGNDEIMLTGNSIFNPFVVKIQDMIPGSFSSGQVQKINFQTMGSIQVEAICENEDFGYYISAEYNSENPAILLHLDCVSTSSILHWVEVKPKIYPNPATSYIYIEEPGCELIRIFDLNGNLVQKSNNKRISLIGLQKGSYIVFFILYKLGIDFFNRPYGALENELDQEKKKKTT